jgi:hypothetical protein
VPVLDGDRPAGWLDAPGLLRALHRVVDAARPDAEEEPAAVAG